MRARSGHPNPLGHHATSARAAAPRTRASLSTVKACQKRCRQEGHHQMVLKGCHGASRIIKGCQ
eukprot:1484018-Pyramimonas_sp.AAC.1